METSASGESGKIKLPRTGTEKINELYIYTLPVAIGESEESRRLGYLMVGANIKKDPSETLEKLFCKMVELTGAQIEVYGEECGLTGME